MRKNFSFLTAMGLTAALLATGNVAGPARADDAQSAVPAPQPATAADIETSARDQAGCGFAVEVHFIDGRTESTRWEMAPGHSATATAFCRGHAAVQAFPGGAAA